MEPWHPTNFVAVVAMNLGGRAAHHAQLLHTRPRRHRVCALLDQVRRVDPDDVHRHHLLVFLLYRTFAMPFPSGCASALESSPATPRRSPLLRRARDGPLLGGTHHGNLRVGEARRGDGVVVRLVRPAADALDGADALGGRGVGQHHLAVGVAGAVHAGDHLPVVVAGQNPPLAVDGDESALGLDARLLESRADRVREAPGGDQCRRDAAVGGLLSPLGDGAARIPAGPRAQLLVQLRGALLYSLVFLLFWFNGAGPLSVDLVIYNAISTKTSNRE